MFPRHHRAPNWATHVRSRYIAAIGSSEAGASHCNLSTLGDANQNDATHGAIIEGAIARREKYKMLFVCKRLLSDGETDIREPLKAQTQ
jgi:hypothetical protein